MGDRIIGQIKCPSCSRFMPSDAAVCPYCGLVMVGSDASPQVARPASPTRGKRSKGKLAIIAATVVVAILILAILLSALAPGSNVPSRNDVIPEDAVKMTPATDLFKPVMHSSGWESPVVMPGPINTAGAEDSPFITPDGNRFFFFFTPDVRVPVQQQLTDKVTGIWWSEKAGGSWTEPKRIILSNDVALDGAEFVQGNTMWFASVRAGNYGEIDIYTADYANGNWGNVKNAGMQLNVDYDIGEFHITADGGTMYFHGAKSATNPDYDIWKTTKTSGGWSLPVQVPGLSTGTMEGWPFVTSDGNELWFTGWSTLGYQGPAIFRCIKNGTGWDAPVEIISNFAGECTMDSDGNLYFVHHYYRSNMTMIEADIYVAYKKAIVSAAEADGIAAAGPSMSEPVPVLLKHDAPICSSAKKFPALIEKT
jgi:hypothetical protein